MSLGFDSFRARLLVFILPLLAAVSALTLLLSDAANTENAKQLIRAQLEDEADRLDRAIRQRSRHLADSTRLLTADFAFKRAYSLGDTGTLRSAMANHLSRLHDGELMVVLDAAGRPVAAVGANTTTDDAVFAPLADAARGDEYGEAAGVIMVDGPFQMVVSPLLAPRPVAWVAVGFRLDDAFLRDFRVQTEAELSLVALADGVVRLFASTLDDAQREDLAGRKIPEGDLIDLGRDESVLELRPLETLSATPLQVLLHRSLEAALAPYRELRGILIALFVVALLVSSAGVILIARSVSRPVSELAHAAGAVQEGDLTRRVPVRGRNELSRLAERFNAMVEGLAERDRTRDLLGKVVSRQVAERLLESEPELGGEERHCTVLFADIRRFTGLCEGRSPADILHLLNAYFTDMTRVVDEHGGVVDKFIGDALMAIFGAPVQQAEHSGQAVRAALGMQAALTRFNADRPGGERFEIGIGLATGDAVAGNMGSAQRLNYTVIGDVVNVAARIEGLCPRYGTGLLASGETLRESGHRPAVMVDRVRVAGRARPVELYLPMALDDPDAAATGRFEDALSLERDGEFDAARSAFESITPRGALKGPVAVHRRRCAELAGEPPPVWDGVIAWEK